MKEFKIDVAVLCLFFNRPDNFGKVFEQVRIARPSKLFLYQDGPRNENDMQGILECREIAKQIDWNCEVHTLFQEKNYGCDPSEFLSQKWMFSHVEKGIVLEDDDVPSQSFFSFCKELLDRYENDSRISIISGINYQETTESPYDDIFSSDMAIWGWATWKRVVDCWDSEYTFVNDTYYFKKVTDIIHEHKYRKGFIDAFRRHKSSGIEYYETILYSYHLLNSCLSIVPTHNMITNIGSVGGTHFNRSMECLHPLDRKLFDLKRFEIDFPLRHPKYVIEDVAYKHYVDKFLARDKPWLRCQRRVYVLFALIRYRIKHLFDK